MRTRTLILTLPLTLLGCSDKSDTGASDTGGSTDTGGSDTGGSDTGGSTDSAALGDCADAASNAELVACATALFLDTLTEDELAQATFDFDDATSKTLWSNLPTTMVDRAGLRLADMSEESKAAVDVVAQALLSESGYEDFVGVRAADEYLSTLSSSGGGPGGSDYSSDYYYIAVFGEPGTVGDWELMLGGHHMAYNVTWHDGVAYPTPNHLGSEPKAAFSLDGTTYAPVVEEGADFAAIFESLGADDLDEAFLGVVMADVLLGPDEYGTGSEDAVEFPTGSEREGVLVSSLSAEQQALVTAAVGQWVEDFDPEISAPLMEAYTSTEAYDDTLVSWSGTESAGPDVDVSGTYFRVDGPRLWLELAVQTGVMVRDETHYHTIFRDKEADYGGSL